MYRFITSVLIVTAFVSLVSAPAIAAADTNLITNPSFENGTTGWNTVLGNWNSTSFTYPVVGFDGQHAAQVKVSRYSSGDIFWQPSNALVTAGQKYVFSGYSKNSVPVDVVAAYIKSGGGTLYETLGTVPASSNWQQFTSTFTIPSGVTKVRIQHVIRAVGTLAVDQYSLTPAATSTGGTGTTTPPTNPPPATIVSFTANPTTTTAGQSSTLSWSLTNAASFAVMNGATVVAQSGTSVAVSPSATTTYTLFAYNGGTATTSSTATVTVTPAPVTPPIAPTCTISANPTSIVSGNSSTLTFNSTYASSSSIDNNIGAVPPSGTQVVSPTATTTYTMTVTNPGSSTTCKTTVNVAPKVVQTKPTISSFTATPPSITAGQSSALAWQVTGATLLTIDQGVGTVTGTSKSVSPSATTTYTLSAGNSAGTTTATVTVNVAPVVVVPPPSNLIPNGNLEQGSTNAPTNWNADFWGSLTAKFTYPVTGKGGGKAAQVTVSNYSSGDAKWDFNHVTVSPHTIYTYTEDYESNVRTSITIEYQLSNGTFDYEWVKDVATSTSWASISVPIFVPSNAVSFTVLHTLTSNGSLTIDNASLVAGQNDQFANGMVTFAFDDGLLSQFQNAQPILKAANMTAGFYIITNEPTSGDSDQMTWAQIKTLKSAGYEIGGHTRTHPFLTTLTPAQLTSEVTGSYQDLVAQGITPTAFVYPYGDLNSTVEAAVKTAGYTIARGSYFGENSTQADPLDLEDIRLDTTSTLAGVEAHIDQAKADKRWIVFEIHDVEASGGDEYTITPSFFQSVVNYVKASGVQVATLSQGGALLQ